MANGLFTATTADVANVMYDGMKCATEDVKPSALMSEDGCEGKVDDSLQCAHTTWFNEVTDVLDMLTNKVRICFG